MKNAVIAALAVALGVSIAVGVIAEASRTVNVEVRVWQDVDDAGAFWLSARPDGGSWADLGTIPVPLDDGLSGTGRYRYGDVTLALSVPPPPSCADASLAADCAVLLATRDALAGDGALNWSADVPVTEWDGVSVSGTPRRVTGLDLRNRGLTGSIPPELGSLPPTLATLYLAGNALTGCVPERLRLAENNDLEPLMAERRIWYCPVPPILWSEDALRPGTHQYYGGLIVDIPASDLKVDTCGLLHVDFATPEDIPEGQSSNALCFGDLDGRWEMWLDRHYGVEWNRYPTDPDTDGQTLPADVDALFDQIATTARPAPLPSCWDEPDCAVLRAARDTLAGDGTLNWSADIHMRRWDGVTIADWAWSPPWRVTKLDLRNRGLTGSIPPELGSLPPTLATLYLAGNALTGCVPERLRLAENNDLEPLMAERRIWYCPVPPILWSEDALRPGTHQYYGGLIVDIPASDLKVDTCGLLHVDFATPEDIPEGQSSNALCFGDLDGRWEMWLDRHYGVEWNRYPTDPDTDGQTLPADVDALFDQIATTARPAPLPSCWDEPDCAVLRAARDTLAGDGTLNWSANIHMRRWDGVTIADWAWSPPWRVTELDLRNRGLTGTIPPELGSLPPSLWTVYLAGNAFTGCVPERLRLAAANDLERLMAERGLSWCPVPPIPWSEEAIPPGTYQVQGNLIVDIPVATVQAKISSIYASDGGPGSGRGYCFSDLAERWEVCLDASSGEEILRAVPPKIHSAGANGASSSTPPAEVDALLDQIAATARPAPP